MLISNPLKMLQQVIDIKELEFCGFSSFSTVC
jgi:hypothetical protein